VYAALWRLLPGPTWFRVVEACLLVLVLCAVLLLWVFPAVEPHLPFDEIVIGEG